MQETTPVRRRVLSGHLPAAALIGMLGALGALSLVPTPAQRVGPATLSVSAAVGEGATVVRLPPFGTVEARTHGAPLRVEATLEAVDPMGLADAVTTTEARDRLVAGMEAELRAAARGVGRRLALAGFLLGGVVAALLPRRRPSGVAAGAAAGLLSVAVLLAATSRGYDAGAFSEARYTGTLVRAPQIVEAVQRHGTSIGEIRSQYRAAAERLAELVALAGAPDGNPRTGTVALLHVSDIHSNPLGAELAVELAGRFAVDAVLDTGDLTSFGEPLETRIGELVAGAGRPWLWVPGNHDSPAVRNALAAVPNVVRLDRTVATVGDVRILGWGDPTFTPGSPLSNEDARRAQLAEAPAVAERTRAETPDVLAVHNADLATASPGLVPLVLSGHSHTRRERTVDGTLELAVGSTGATGLGSFLVEGGRPYEAQIVYFRDRRAVAVDYIRFGTSGTEFEIQRRTLAEPERAPSPAPPVVASPTPSPEPDAPPAPPSPPVPGSPGDGPEASRSSRQALRRHSSHTASGAIPWNGRASRRPQNEQRGRSAASESLARASLSRSPMLREP